MPLTAAAKALKCPLQTCFQCHQTQQSEKQLCSKRSSASPPRRSTSLLARGGQNHMSIAHTSPPSLPLRSPVIWAMAFCFFCFLRGKTDPVPSSWHKNVKSQITAKRLSVRAGLPFREALPNSSSENWGKGHKEKLLMAQFKFPIHFHKNGPFRHLPGI